MDFNFVFLKLHFKVFGDYLHLTRQHWISSLSLILPGNDDDRHLQAMAKKRKDFAFSRGVHVEQALDQQQKQLSGSILPDSAGLYYCCSNTVW